MSCLMPEFLRFFPTHIIYIIINFFKKVVQKLEINIQKVK
nr:MAG TPA: hypothetical protein [Caudoviricetes sp.]